MDLIFDILSNVENPIIVFFISVFIGFLVIFKSEISTSLLLKPNKKLSIQSKIANLKNHDVFNTLKRIALEVSNMKFYTDCKYDYAKTKMCEDFTNMKSNVCGKYMLEFLDYGIENMDRDKLKKTIVDIQNLMHKEYIHKIRLKWEDKNIKPEDINYVIELFEKFRYDVVNSFEHRINSIFGSSNYKDNFSLTLAVFEMWAMGIDLLPRDMQTTFENLNGKFKNIKY